MAVTISKECKKNKCFWNEIHCQHCNDVDHNFWKDVLANTRKNSQEKGKSLCRRMSTKEPLTIATKCRVLFTIGYGDTSFYIKCGCGNNSHVSNPHYSCSKNINVSSKMMTPQQSIMRLCDRAKSGDTSTLDMFNLKTSNKHTRNCQSVKL